MVPFEKRYDSEGFCLRWGPDGIEVEVTDYHAEVLRLGWEEILGFAERAAKAPRDAVSPRVRMRKRRYLKAGNP